MKTKIHSIVGGKLIVPMFGICLSLADIKHFNLDPLYNGNVAGWIRRQYYKYCRGLDAPVLAVLTADKAEILFHGEEAILMTDILMEYFIKGECIEPPARVVEALNKTLAELREKGQFERGEQQEKPPVIPQYHVT